jgi:cell filamentation protein
MKDPYLYPDSQTLINLFDEKNEDRLDKIEADFTGFRLRQLVEYPVRGKFDFAHLCAVHQFVFQDIFAWAGKPRTVNIQKAEAALGGLSVEYSDFKSIKSEVINACSNLNNIDWNHLLLKEKAEKFAKLMAVIWKIHPFREGNTRTVITFCCDFAEKHGFPLNRDLFKDNSTYVRRALAAANAVLKDFGDRSKPQYLIDITYDAISRR